MSGNPSQTLVNVRRLLLAVLALGLVGTSAELWLMGHHEDWKQLIPLVMMGVSLVSLAWFWRAKAGGSVGLFRLCMLLMVVTGGVGSVLHSRANMEFQLEMDASLSGMALLTKVLHAKAPPALAPGNMALLGLLGLIGTLGVERPSGTPRA